MKIKFHVEISFWQNEAQILANIKLYIYIFIAKN
jgi:hypothetical protein